MENRKVNRKENEKKLSLLPVILTYNLLQTQVLRVEQVNEPCIGLTQENSVQNCLPFILNYNGLCYYFSSLS